ncbi:MAG: 1-acyl-sn-glycerol-3-phosphate acyltransferase [Halocynthiibacter sp.]
MFKTVELPLWALVLIVLFAAVTFASHFLLPSVRWFFRRRMEKVVSRLNLRLQRPIEPFKLARRHDMIQRLIYDPKIAAAIAKHAREEKIPENVAFEKARRYAREIVPSFSATVYFGVAFRIARWFSRTLYRVRLGHYDENAIKKIAPDATVIFVMNHRSNMDYLLVSYLVADQSALSYAVGEWAQVWPLRSVIRALGAYFIRRRSRNTLYRRVLARYVQLATENGVTQAVFPEGGLSLDGTVRPAKLGLLNYILSDFTPGQNRDVVFVPVAINYDRVLEDRVLVAAALSGNRKFKSSIFSMLAFVGRQIRFKLTGRYHRFGYAAVSFGNPLSLKQFVSSRSRSVEKVGEELVARIKAVIPVLPVPLVATVLQQAMAPLKRDEIAEQVELLIANLSDHGAYVHLPRNSSQYAADVGLRMLVLRNMVAESEGGYAIVPAEKAAVAYYAASISHLVDASAA